MGDWQSLQIINNFFRKAEKLDGEEKRKGEKNKNKKKSNQKKQKQRKQKQKGRMSYY